ncbi:unnamed protein product [Vitrella brassicaformis CCMP3155]|uniref:Uncharacterized protein n=1 Tax=Vitrella brassicaformis (strain CCMP3155) TaxID=1169540 RepID=A0A0G4EKL8_VITBC|nr:unnamed protein product [Vitrella brassicaformis CCMP3155]|eukprot:CEL97080.1 unnamed protein product [Vitrella brassicaformis CCMP3155]
MADRDEYAGGATGTIDAGMATRHGGGMMSSDAELVGSHLSDARAHKADGNNLMAKKAPKAALTEYKKAMEALEAIKSVDMGSWMAHTDEVQQLTMSVWSNSALAALKADLLDEVLTYADLLLAHDDTHPKALLRRACARRLSGDFDGAVADLRKLKASHENYGKEADDEMALLAQHIQQHKAKEHQLYGGMFEKMSLYESPNDREGEGSEEKDWVIMEQDKSLIDLGMGYAFRPAKASKGTEHTIELPPVSFDDQPSDNPATRNGAGVFTVGSATVTATEGRTKRASRRLSARPLHYTSIKKTPNNLPTVSKESLFVFGEDQRLPKEATETDNNLPTAASEGVSAFGESKHLLKEATETGSQPTTEDGTQGGTQEPTVGFWGQVWSFLFPEGMCCGWCREGHTHN